jgi:hypothetical protein
VEAVGHRTAGGDAVGPLPAPVAKGDAAGEHVPAVGRVGRRRRKPDAHLTVGADADGLVAEPLARLAIGLQEPPPGLPPQPPLCLSRAYGKPDALLLVQRR